MDGFVRDRRCLAHNQIHLLHERLIHIILRLVEKREHLQKLRNIIHGGHVWRGFVVKTSQHLEHKAGCLQDLGISESRYSHRVNDRENCFRGLDIEGFFLDQFVFLNIKVMQFIIVRGLLDGGG